MSNKEQFYDATLAEALAQKFLREKFQAKSTTPNALKLGIEVVTVDNTANWWPRNPLEEIFEFRGREVDALGWRDHIHFVNHPITDRMGENDNSDTHGTVYFVKRFQDDEIACTVRVHPSVDLYGRDISMIGRNIPQLIQGEEEKFKELLKPDFWETSRVIVDDKRLPARLENGERNLDRRQAARECLAASAIYSQVAGYKGFFCFMPVSIWNATYPKLGLEVQRLGPNVTMQDQEGSPEYQVHAGYMNFTPEILQRVTENSGISLDSLNFGTPPEKTIVELITYLEQTRAANDLGSGSATSEKHPPEIGDPFAEKKL